MNALPGGEAVLGTFPSSPPLLRAKRGSPVTLSEVTGPVTTGIGAGCVGFPKYDSKMLKDALLCGVRYYDFGIMLFLPFLFFAPFV